MPTRGPVAVEAYAGGSYPGHPRAITWRGRRYEVDAVKQQWRTPEALVFVVRCQGGPCLTLYYDDSSDTWSAEALAAEEPLSPMKRGR